MRNSLAQQRARRLRKRLTEAERRLWLHLRKRRLSSCRFRRQFPIGPFIADFASLEARLVIEVDGGQHADSSTDPERDRYLRSCGYRVLRFWNNEVLQDTEAVLEAIHRAVR